MPRLRCGARQCEHWNDFGCEAPEVRLMRSRGSDSAKMEAGQIGVKRADELWAGDDCKCESFKVRER